MSLICHLVFVLSLVDVEFSGKKPDISDVYEVSIVPGVPASGEAASKSASTPETKKFIFNKKSEHASLGEVKKEKSLKEGPLKLTPSEIKRETPEESGPDTTGASSLVKPPAQSAIGTGTAHGTGGGSSSEVALWKMKVDSMVHSLWKAPPEIDTMDKSLNATYILRVSRTGELLQKKLIVSSGNVPYDRSVLIALSKVSRFPQPPLVIIAGEDWLDITMSFRPVKGDH
ncbi:MAG TPA: cell envelope integrity protein TolA [Desulfomonilia bacterium]|nr:cell envelope integrity protein TolA [Desulfomonilia bacterium]